MIEYRTVNSVASAPTQDAIVKYAPYRNVVTEYLSANYLNEPTSSIANSATVQAAPVLYSVNHLEEVLSQASEDFSLMLLRLSEERGISQVDLYKNAGIARQVFYRIRNDRNYRPAKVTVLCFALTLQLSLDETIDLLSRAGYALSPSNRGDLIIRFFIENQVYDPTIINAALFEHGLPTLLLGIT